jgi:cystathionine beta-synthase
MVASANRHDNVLQMIGHTPLIRLTKVTEALTVTIWAKVEHLNPGGSVKDRIALAMIEDAEKTGQLKPGGTISGTGRYLKERKPDILVVGADPAGSILSGDSPHSYKVEGVGEDFVPATFDRQAVDEMVRVTDRESFAMARRLACEEGLLVGGSSGMAVAAVVRYAHRLSAGKVIVVLLADTGRNYLTKIFSDERNGQVVGSLTEVTLLRLLHDGKNLRDMVVAEVMGKPMPQIDEGTDIAEPYRLLMAGHNGVVVTRGASPCGFLSRIDLADFWTKQVEQKGKKK